MNYTQFPFSRTMRGTAKNRIVRNVFYTAAYYIFYFGLLYLLHATKGFTFKHRRMSTYPVKLKLYDLSRGMVKTWSPIVLGKTIEGIWHTAVIVYDMEYFYGGGILCLEPNEFESMYNIKPVKIIDMGATDVNQSIFHDYLNSIQSQFSVDKYNIVTWNCNHFTNEICNFLVGKNIPEHILNLPLEVMATSQGKMILDMMQSYQNVIAPGFENAESSSNTNLSKAGSSNTRRETDMKKVPSVTIGNVFDNHEQDEIRKILDELANNSKYTSSEKKTFLNALLNVIDAIQKQPQHITSRIIYKDSNGIFKNISIIKEHVQILALLGFHQAFVETNEYNKSKKIVIFLDAKNKTKITEDLHHFIEKKVFLKKNSACNYSYVVHFKSVVDYIPYVEKHKDDKSESAFIFISMLYVNEMFNDTDTKNDIKYFNNVKEKSKALSTNEKNELTLLAEILRKCIKVVNECS